MQQQRGRCALRTSARDWRLLHSVAARIAQHTASSSPAPAQLARGADVSGAQSLPPSSNPLAAYVLPYAGKPSAVRLVASQVALPESTAFVRLLDALPAPDAALWSRPSPLVLRALADVPAVLPTASVFADRTEWVLLVRRMVALDMVAVSSTKPLCVNGAFGVPKDADSVRLIVDARAANAYFLDAPNPLLPTPADISQLQLPPGKRLLVAKCDLSNCYHSLKVPAWLTAYFGLPPVTAGELGLPDLPPETLVWPRCLRLPMGFAPAVHLAQKCTVRMMVASGVPPCDLVLPGFTDTSLDRPRVVVYLDDAIWLACEEHRGTVTRLQSRYVATATTRGWLVSAKKLRLPAFSGDVLGLVMDGVTGTFGLSVEKMDAIIAAIDSILRFPFVDVRTLQALVGRLVWAFLAFRPALSAFDAVFRWSRQQDRLGLTAAPLGPAVIRELAIAAAILPLARTDLRAPLFEHCVATDASEFALGVVACSPDRQLLREAAAVSGVASIPGNDTPYSIEPALLQLLRGNRWRVLVSSPVRHAARIAALEASAVFVGLRWCLSTPSAIGASIVVLCDNTPVVCALAKGRSSSPLLRANIARLAAFLLAAGSRLTVLWVPSRHNPADAASRLLV